MSHLEVLEEMLDIERREIAGHEYAVQMHEEDVALQRDEGFDLRAEKTQQRIERHKMRRTIATLRAAALASTIVKLKQGDFVTPISIPIKRIHPDATIPAQAKESDAGYDLYALERYDLDPQEREMFRTGISVAIPDGYVGYIKPRSGLAARNGLDVLGGVIDSGYRGEIGVILLNTDVDTTIHVARGDRIAQLVIQPVTSAAFEEVTELPSSERGEGGFGSTGTR